MALPDWLRFRRWNERPKPDEMAEKRMDIEKNRHAYELVGTAVFRDTFHEELDELVDRWLVEPDADKAAALWRQARALLTLGQRLQTRAQKHHDRVSTNSGQHEVNRV